MGNTWSKVLIAAAMSTSVTSENTQEFDVELFRKNWMQYLNEQNAKRRRDKYLMRDIPSYNSRNILSHTNNNLISNATIQEARNLNEALYVLPSSIGVESKLHSDIYTRFYEIFKSITIPQDPRNNIIRMFKPDAINLNDPTMKDFEILAIFAKIAWTKKSQKGVKNQYLTAKGKADQFESNVKSTDDKLKFAEFWFGAAQIFYASDNYPLVMQCVKKTEKYADMLMQTGDDTLVKKAQQVKYRAQVEMAKALREKGEMIHAEQLTQSIIDISRGKEHLLWSLAYALNNMVVIYSKTNRFELCEPLSDESERIRVTIGDGQSVTTSWTNKAKTLVAKKEHLEALHYYEKSRDWRVANADTWGVAGSDFAFGRAYVKMAEFKYNPIFYGMAVRRYIPGLKVFRENMPRLGECETSEYFTILLTNIDAVEDAKIVAIINLFFRQLTTPGRLGHDIAESLWILKWLSDEDKQMLSVHSETPQAKAKIAQLQRDYKWPGSEEGAVEKLQELLEKYKDAGLSTTSTVNYLEILDEHIERRDDDLKSKAPIAGNHLAIGTTYIEMGSKGGYGDIFIALGVREFIKALELTQDKQGKDVLETAIRTTLEPLGSRINFLDDMMATLKQYENVGVR